jgi:hypothetical protein
MEVFMKDIIRAIRSEINISTKRFERAKECNNYAVMAVENAYREGLMFALEPLVKATPSEKNTILTERKAFNKDGEEVDYAIVDGDFTFMVPVGYTLVKKKSKK